MAKRWGSCDYKQLQKLRQNLAKLQEVDMDRFCREVSKELAARLLALVIPRTPVGQYPKASGKKGGTLRRGWTAGSRDAKAYAQALPIDRQGSTYTVEVINPVPAMWSSDTAPGAARAGWMVSISSPSPNRTCGAWPPA
mgnify:CR=1 FL=1